MKEKACPTCAKNPSETSTHIYATRKELKQHRRVEHDQKSRAALWFVTGFIAVGVSAALLFSSVDSSRPLTAGTTTTSTTATSTTTTTSTTAPSTTTTTTTEPPTTTTTTTMPKKKQEVSPIVVIQKPVLIVSNGKGTGGVQGDVVSISAGKIKANTSYTLTWLEDFPNTQAGLFVAATNCVNQHANTCKIITNQNTVTAWYEFEYVISYKTTNGQGEKETKTITSSSVSTLLYPKYSGPNPTQTTTTTVPPTTTTTLGSIMRY